MRKYEENLKSKESGSDIYNGDMKRKTTVIKKEMIIKIVIKKVGMI